MTWDYEARKQMIDYNISVQNRLSEAAVPLHSININYVTYTRFLLDDNGFCDKGFFVRNHVPSSIWICENVFANGSEYEKAIKTTEKNELSFFLHPTNNHDFIMSSDRELFGLQDGLTIYFRQKDFIECWDFHTTFDNNIMNSQILSSSTIKFFTNYVNFFKKHFSELMFYDSSIYYHLLQKADYTNSNNSFKNFNCSETLSVKPKLINIGNKQIALTKRDKEYIALIGKGKKIKEIALEFNISFNTAKEHIDRIKYKTECAYTTDIRDLYYAHFNDLAHEN